MLTHLPIYLCNIYIYIDINEWICKLQCSTVRYQLRTVLNKNIKEQKMNESQFHNLELDT